MSFESSEPRHARRIAGVLALVLVLLCTPEPDPAGEARGRGRKAIITWVDEDGEPREADARDLRYGYYDRSYLSVPKNGKTYKDTERTEKGLPIAGSFTHFARLDSIEFEWVTVPETGSERLNLKLTLPGGKARMVSGAELAGAGHPLSPFFEFTAEGVDHRIELHPLAPEDQRRGKPHLLSIAFYL